jgi:hypothetical protein
MLEHTVVWHADEGFSIFQKKEIFGISIANKSIFEMFSKFLRIFIEIFFQIFLKFFRNFFEIFFDFFLNFFEQ